MEHKRHQAGTISIHALREEGDDNVPYRMTWDEDFYPRPPRGGRHGNLCQKSASGIISIHALREEGDASSRSSGTLSSIFLSTPSARRATNADA